MENLTAEKSMQNEQFDPEELLHLAVKASNADDIDKAMDYLKRAISISPNDAKAHYFLGALHAEIGMFDRAIADMTKATEIDPDFLVAYFQMGQVYITLNDVDAAEEVWKALDHLGEDNFYFLFKRGMLNVMRGNYEACIKDMKKGIELNNTNESLTNDMQRLLVKAEDALALEKHSTGATVTDISSAKDSQSGTHTLSAYQQSDNDDD